MNQTPLDQNDKSQPKQAKQKNVFGIVGLVCGIILAMLLFGDIIGRGGSSHRTIIHLLILVSAIGVISSILGMIRSQKVGGLTVSFIGFMINALQLMMLISATLPLRQ